MRTYHDEKLGWQFIQNVGEKYIEWLEKRKEVLNEIFKVIKNTNLPKQENEQEGEQSNEQSDQEGETEAEKMNNILRQNSGGQDGEQSNEQSEQKGGQEGEQSNEKGEQDGEQSEQSNDTYQGQRQDVVLKGGKKKFRL